MSVAMPLSWLPLISDYTRNVKKPFAVAVCIIGMFLAIFTKITKIETFLYFIGSVFAPMIAIIITDYFILKKDNSSKNADMSNIILWVVGFLIYRIFMRIDTPIGYTLPAMLIIGFICIISDRLNKHFSK